MATPRLKGQWPTIMPSSAFHPTRTDPRSRPPTATSPAATTRTSGATGRRWPRSTRRGASSGGTNCAWRTTPLDGSRDSPRGMAARRRPPQPDRSPLPQPAGASTRAGAPSPSGATPTGRSLSSQRTTPTTSSGSLGRPRGSPSARRSTPSLRDGPGAGLQPDGHGDAPGTVPIEVRPPPPLVAEAGLSRRGRSSAPPRSPRAASGTVARSSHRASRSTPSA